MSFLCKAKIIKCNYSKDSYRIFNCSPIAETPKELTLSEYFTFSVKGELAYLSENKEYELELEVISESPKFGSTCKVISIPSLSALDLDTLTLEQSEEILSEITTTTQADYILKAYPDFIRKVLTEGKESIDVKKIYNVGEYRLNAYIRLLTDKYKYLHILQAFKQYEIDITDCKSLYDTYHDDVNITKGFEEKPYRTLINVLGRSFYKTDRLLMEIRPELESECERCEFMILDVLDRNEIDGSSKLNANVLYTVAKEDYNSPQLLPLLKKVAIESDLIYYKEDTNELAKMATYNGECLIASFIKDKINSSKDNIWDIDWNKYTKVDDFQMTETQSLALKNLCESDISILAGYSGSGKSSSVKGIVTLLEDNGKTYSLLTPTGKSARVLAESTGRKASTIHRRCLQGEISEDCLIVDEFGMVSIELACMIINAIQNEHIKVIFVGDPSQIESINVGTVFDDLIKSDIIPTTMLTEIFRYKSNGSLFVATNIRQGKSFFNDTEMVKHTDNLYTVGNNYKFIETDDIFDNVVKEYTNLISKGIKPLNILCLSPMNKGDCGTIRINKAIQEEINPPKPNEKIITRKLDNEEITFRVKDVVINTKNDYNAVSQEAYYKMKEDELLTEEDVADTMVMNGQTGTIREMLDDGMIIQFDEELIYYSKRKVYNLLLAYSISIHKAQGSTIDYSIEIVSEHHSRMLSRGLLYVGTTRNRISHVDIGNIDAFNKALTIDKNEIRKTWLKELLLDNSQ